MIWQNCPYVEECASDLAEFLPVRCHVPVIWQNGRIACASDSAELPVC